MLEAGVPGCAVAAPSVGDTAVTLGQVAHAGLARSEITFLALWWIGQQSGGGSATTRTLAARPRRRAGAPSPACWLVSRAPCEGRSFSAPLSHVVIIRGWPRGLFI